MSPDRPYIWGKPLLVAEVVFTFCSLKAQPSSLMCTNKDPATLEITMCEFAFITQGGPDKWSLFAESGEQSRLCTRMQQWNKEVKSRLPSAKICSSYTFLRGWQTIRNLHFIVLLPFVAYPWAVVAATSEVNSCHPFSPMDCKSKPQIWERKHEQKS